MPRPKYISCPECGATATELPDSVECLACGYGIKRRPEPRPETRRPEPSPVRVTNTTNTLGVVGFVLSLVGLFLTLGLLSPVAWIVSRAAMNDEPKGLATAGVTLGAIGSVLGALTFSVLGILVCHSFVIAHS